MAVPTEFFVILKSVNDIPLPPLLVKSEAGVHEPETHFSTCPSLGVDVLTSVCELNAPTLVK